MWCKDSRLTQIANFETLFSFSWMYGEGATLPPSESATEFLNNLSDKGGNIFDFSQSIHDIEVFFYRGDIESGQEISEMVTITPPLKSGGRMKEITASMTTDQIHGINGSKHVYIEKRSGDDSDDDEFDD